MEKQPDMDEEQDERKVRDLIRARELTVRPRLCNRLMARLDRRRTRRPVGCSARLFAKMGWEDPFAVPGDDRVDAHKPIYVAGRFVRLDQATRLRKKEDPKEKIRRMQEKAAQQRAEALRKAAARSTEASPAQPPPARPPQVAKGPPAEQQADLDRRAAVRAARRGDDDGIDRTLPAPPPPQARRTSSSGRFRSAPQRAGRKVVQGGEPPGGRPPIVVPEEATPGPDEAFARVRRRQAVHRAPVPREEPAPRRKVEVTRVAADAPPEPDPPTPEAAPPPPPELQPEAPPPEPKPVERSPGKAAGSGGMDDLFGSLGSSEGRVRIGRRSRPKPEPEPEPEDEG